MQHRVKFINERGERTNQNFNKLFLSLSLSLFLSLSLSSRCIVLNFETGNNLYSRVECGKEGVARAL